MMKNYLLLMYIDLTQRATQLEKVRVIDRMIQVNTPRMSQNEKEGIIMARTAEIMFKEFHHRYNSEDACRVDSIDEEITGLVKFQPILVSK